MSKRKRCVIKSAVGLILVGCTCRILMKYYFSNPEEMDYEFVDSEMQDTEGTADIIEETTDIHAPADSGGADKTEEGCNTEKQESEDVITESSAESEQRADNGKYVVKKTDTGFVFNINAVNGNTIAVSEVYKSKKSCLNGIRSVSTNAPAAAVEDQTAEGFEKCKNPKFEIYKDKAGEYRFRLKAKNGQIIAASKGGYKAEKSCLDSIDSIRRNADADVMDNTDIEK